MLNFVREYIGNILIERLDKDIYASKEAALENSKKSSQTSTENEIERHHVSYDPFSVYTTSILGDIEKLKTQNDLLVRWRNASYAPEVDGALEEIVNEAIVYDEEEEVIVLDLEDIELSDGIKTKIKESFDKILYLLDFNTRGDELFKQWYVDGILSIESVYNNNAIKEGIQKLILLTPFNFYKIKDSNTGLFNYFYCINASYNAVKDLEKADKIFKEEQISQITSGIWDISKKIPYGFLHKSIKSLNQLNLIEDSLIIFRITRSPEKRVFYVDTGNLPKSKAEEYLGSLIAKYRQKRIYNTDTGELDNKSRQISILEDFWFAVQTTGTGASRGTKVETLQGQNPGFNSFEDVDYFIDKLYKTLGIPRDRRDKEARFQIGSSVDIEREELKFFKRIVKLRRKFNNLFVDLLKKDILSRGIMSLTDWIKIQEKIKFNYASSNEFSLLKKIQLNDIKVASATNATQLLQDKILSKNYIQSNIMGLTEEEIKLIDKDNTEDIVETDDEPKKNFEPKPVPVVIKSEPEEKETPEDDEKPEKKTFPKNKKKKEPTVEALINTLSDGDIITNGVDKLQFQDGMFKKLS